MNSLDGINCPASCTIRGNTCVQNGAGGDGAGIHATLTDNRIEDNNCDLADRGVDVDSAGNIIIRNSCSGNTTNWVIAVNNYYGPIIDRTGVVIAAVNGAAAASTLASADANANFSY
jgi:parallel beta-helix repeat protein